MTNIAFVDCETTHLDAEIGEAWEVAVILRQQDGEETTDTEYVWQFAVDPAAADPEALRIGRFHERYAIAASWEAVFTAYEPVVPMSRADAVVALRGLLRGAVLVGSNPAFDERFLRKLLGPGSAQWHYRPYDIAQLAAAKTGARAAGPLPWSPRVLCRAIGVEPPTEDVAHTALGDARWARDVYDAVMVREMLPLTWEGRAEHAIGLYTQTACELDDARRDLARQAQEMATWRATVNALDAAAPGTPRYQMQRAREIARRLAAHAVGFQDELEASDRGPWAKTVGADITALCAVLEAPSQPVMMGDDGTVPRTERSYWVDIAHALNAAMAAGMPVGIDLDGTLTDHNAWSVIWNHETQRWTVAGYDSDMDDDQPVSDPS